MAGREAKTKPTEGSVTDFLASLGDPRRLAEAQEIDLLHQRVTGCAPRMWGPSIIGYGSYRYRYASGREGEACRAGFSPRKAAMTIYLMGSCGDRQADAQKLFDRLGKHTTGQSCLYVKKLADVNLGVLEDLIALNWRIMNQTYPD